MRPTDQFAGAEPRRGDKRTSTCTAMHAHATDRMRVQPTACVVTCSPLNFRNNTERLGAQAERHHGERLNVPSRPSPYGPKAGRGGTATSAACQDQCDKFEPTIKSAKAPAELSLSASGWR